MRTLAVPIEDELDEALEAASLRTGREKRDLVDEALRRFVLEELQQPLPEPRGDAAARPIEEVLAEMAREVPQSEWDRVPKDLSDQLDHYLYGAPKR